MAEKHSNGNEVGTEVPGGLFVGGVIIAFILIAILVYTNVSF